MSWDAILSSGWVGLAAAAVALVASVALAWMLQRRIRRVHPVVTALLTVVLLLAILVLTVGALVVQMLAQIGAAGTTDVDGAAPAANALIYGMLEAMLIVCIGFPAALVTAFRTRRRLDGG